tara:strand:- start:49 stop:441 length:393 start_codon:yes stop_codon:yes gene_type:complete
MNKIQPNSIEAVILFTLYVCGQDDLIAEEELEQLSIEMPVLQKLYFDIYGEYIEKDLGMIVKNIANMIMQEKSYTGKTISKLEKNTFSKLITDPKIQDISLLASRHAASADGFHRLENKKYSYWAKQWGL